MLAFMSETVGPVEQAHWRNLGNGSVPQWELQRQALREAERVLAEAEPVAGFHGLTFDHFPTFPATMIQPMDEDVMALAESLTAVLPVLDELAADAARSAFNAGIGSGAIFHRNRATLAGMDEPESHSSRCPSRFMGECLCGVAERAAMEAGK